MKMRPQAGEPLPVAICSASGLRVSTPTVTDCAQGFWNWSVTSSC
ncbi:hypothetical protein ACSZNN_08015 [Aeromonas hydrophila]